MSEWTSLVKINGRNMETCFRSCTQTVQPNSVSQWTNLIYFKKLPWPFASCKVCLFNGSNYLQTWFGSCKLVATAHRACSK